MFLLIHLPSPKVESKIVYRSERTLDIFFKQVLVLFKTATTKIYSNKVLHILQIAANDNEDTVYVDMNQAKGNIVSIRTDPLGPRLGFLLDFIHGAQSKCFLDHCSFDIDEPGTPLHDMLNVLSERICLKLKS